MIIDLKDRKFNSDIKGKVCIFFGAGVAKYSGYKLWKELAIDMVDKFWERRKEFMKKKGSIKTKASDFDHTRKESLKQHSNEIEIFDYLFDLDNKVFIEEMRNSFDSSLIKSTKIYLCLKNLYNRGCVFVTTNIDKISL